MTTTQQPNRNDLEARVSPGPPRRGRWPGRDREMPPAPAEPGAGVAEAIGDLTEQLRSLVPHVLSSETVLLDANGTATKQYRVPFQSISVTSFSASRLTVLPSPLGGPQPPTSGPGIAVVAPGGFRVCNMMSNVWSIYGGAPGDVVVIETFARPQPPNAGLLVTNQDGIFGTGADGAAVLDGVAAMPGAGLAANVYTMTRDVMLTSLTINPGITLIPAGNRIFVRGLLTNNGTISAAGNPAAGATAGASTGSGTLTGGRAGGNGTINNGVAGTNGFIFTGNGGQGGNGGTGTGALGGITQSSSNRIYSTPYPILAGVAAVFNNILAPMGGPGGGGGGGDTVNAGGGGGSGGGIIAILAWAIVNNGLITAPGGAGGNGAGGNSGGGGGGAGGVILAYTLAAWIAGTTNVAGGALGTLTGTGVNGTAGQAGGVLNVVLG